MVSDGKELTDMKKLSKTQQGELDEWVRKLAIAKQNIDDAFTKLEETHGELKGAVDEYNGVLSEVTEWRDGITGQMEEYQGERSDKWQEGEAGEQYQSWLDAWTGIDLDEVEYDDLPELPDIEHIENLENLPLDSADA
jgi:hypothetical protein